MVTQTMTQSQMEVCIKNCTDCHSTCLTAVTYCLDKGGDHAKTAHIQILLDCAQICQTSTDFMLSQSVFHPQICGVCAQICEKCAAACDRMGNDVQMIKCAEACRRCAQTCQEMAAMTM